MREDYLMGVDLGTSLVKAGIYNIEGNCLAYAAYEVSQERPQPGVFLQSGEEFVQLALATIKAVLAKSGVDGSSVTSVGFSGQMGGAIGVDSHGQAITEWSNPLDTRYLPCTTRMLREAGERIVRESGSNAPYFGPKVLWWKEHFPQLYERVAKFLFLSGFVMGRLCDLKVDDAFVDRTYLEMSGLADIPGGQWSQTLCEQFGIPLEKLPRIVESTTVIGRLSQWAADACGLPRGTPLVAGAGDKPAGFLGAGIVDPGMLVDESSTVGALSLCADEYVPDVKHRTLENLPSPIPGHFYPTTFLIGSGATHSWYKETFGVEEKQEAAQADISAFEILDRKAAAVPPGSDGLLAIGMLSGRGYPSDPDIRGLWMGFSSHHTKAHFYRSLLESFAYEYAYVLKVMRETYPSLAMPAVHVIGGGAASDLWNQIKSDVLGLPYIRLREHDYAVRGDALLAGAGIGVYQDPRQEARKLMARDKRYEPDASNHEHYRSYVQLYESLFDRLRDLFESLNRRSSSGRKAGESYVSNTTEQFKL